MNALSSVGQAFTAAASWVADDTMYLLARTGFGVGPEVYSDLEPRMTTPPKNVFRAYDQAAYFLSLASRRALDTGERDAAAALLAAAQAKRAEAAELRERISFMCRVSGLTCPSGSAAILRSTITSIDESGLNIDDRTQIRAILRANRRAVIAKQVTPLIAAAALGSALGFWWYRRPQSPPIFP